MATGKSTWKRNKLLTARRNYFFNGGNTIMRGIASNNPGFATEIPGMAGVYGTTGTSNIDSIAAEQNAPSLGATQGNVNNGNIGSSINMGGLAGAAMADLTKMATRIQGNDVKAAEKALIANAYGSQVGEQPRGLGMDGVIAAYKNTPVLAHATRKDYGYQKAGAVIGDALMEGLEGSMTGLFGANGGKLAKPNKFMGGGPIGAIIGGVMGTATSLIGNLSRNSKIDKSLNNTVNPLIDYINGYNNRALANMANNANNDQMSGLLSNYSAFGGPIDNWDGAIGYDFMNDYLTSKRMAAEGKSNRLQALPNVDMMALGGNLMTHGADWNTNLMYIGNGGSHESNPYEGIPMGVDQEGTPNLVEEGETIFNDYVFSRRLMVPKAIRNKYKLGGQKNISFAEFSQKLAKESEERPLDPISQRGLEAMMADLANAQETLKAKRGQNSFANGGKVNKFDTGSKMRRNNGPLATSDPLYQYFSEYLGDNGAVDFNKLYDTNSAWSKKRQQAIDLLNGDWETSRPFREWYAKQLNAYNSGYEGYTDRTADDITAANFSKWSSDKDLGFGHRVMGYTDFDSFFAPLENIDTNMIANDEVKHMLRQGIGKDAIPMPGSDIYTDELIDGYSWNDRFKDKYKRVNTSPIDGVYYYDLVEPDSPKKNTYRWMVDGKEQIMGDDYATVINSNNLRQTRAIPNQTGGYDYFYEPHKDPEPLKKSKWEKIAGISALNNLGQFAYNLATGPDYSNANAMIEAAKNPGLFTEVSAHPIGNYVRQDPMDVERLVTNLNTSAGASRRAFLNNAAGNRGTAAAGIVALDNNLMGGIGDAYRQAREYNRDDRYKVEDFNRATDMFNAEDARTTELANQNARASAASATMNGLMTAYAARQRAKENYDASLTANLNGLFKTLEDKAYEAKNDNMIRWLLNQGWRPGAESYRAAKGGKLKKRKGLTH